MAELLAEYQDLTIAEAAAEDVMLDGAGAARGLRLASGQDLTAPAIILTTGTFLRGIIHVGLDQTPAGRVGEPPAIGLAESPPPVWLCHWSPENRHPGEARWQDHRLEQPRSAAGG